MQSVGFPAMLHVNALWKAETEEGGHDRVSTGTHSVETEFII